MNRTRFVFVLIIVVLHLAGVCHATDDVVECPGKDEAFVTTCSGNDSNKDSEATDAEEPSHDDPPSVIDSVDFDEDDIVNEVLEDSDSQNNDDFEQDEEAGVCDAIYSENTPIQQLKANFNTLTKRYYDPLPRNGKVAIGTSLGFIASRISLGVANRLFRVAGAIIVLSEMMYTSGFCDEAQCVPEEARPWIGILKRTIVNQCMKVRVWARKVYDQDKIRELAQKDEFVAGGFATGAFIGFVI
ncbi:hypothetical protein ACHAWT_007201 [Skeletonema menzelii]